MSWEISTFFIHLEVFDKIEMVYAINFQREPLVLFTIILFVHSISWGSVDELGNLIQGLDHLGEIDPRCKSMSDHDIASQCAEEVCGAHKKNVSVVTASNYRQILKPEEVKKIDAIPQKLNSYLSVMQKNAAAIDQKIFDIKSGKAPASELRSHQAQELIKLYPLKSKVDALVKEKKNQLPDIAANCRAYEVINLINQQQPREKLYHDALQKIDKVYISKLSPDSARKLRQHLAERVRIEFKGLETSSFDYGAHNLDRNPMQGNDIESMVSFAKKINTHVNAVNCNSQLSRGPQPLITDSVIYDPSNQQSTLNMSPFSCSHEEASETIVAHEIGHIISNFMNSSQVSSSSKKKFLEQRECVKKQGVTVPDIKKTKFKKDFLTTEEDHADAIALSIQSPSSNLCSFMGSDGKQFLNLEFRLNHQSSHSPAILRVIRNFHLKGHKLPDTCRELATRGFPPTVFQHCPFE
jgi:hypothetical protein